jgi:2'-5' RNA ligase
MQFPLFGTWSGDRDDDLSSVAPDNMVYVVLKPSAALADRISRFEDTTRTRPSNLLHTTIQPIGSRQWLTDADIELTCRTLARVRYEPFLLRFDRIEGGDHRTLCGGDLDNPAAQDFRLAVIDALSSHFRWLPAYRLHPHMTLDYRSRGPGRLLDQPIAWLIEEFMLIESVHGETRHIEWGRWRLGDG